MGVFVVVSDRDIIIFCVGVVMLSRGVRELMDFIVDDGWVITVLLGYVFGWRFRCCDWFYLMV